MSQKGMKRIRLGIEAFNRRDLDALLRWHHPNVVYQTAIASMEGEGGVYHGHEGIRQWSRDLDEAMEGLTGNWTSSMTWEAVATWARAVCMFGARGAVRSSMSQWPGSTWVRRPGMSSSSATRRTSKGRRHSNPLGSTAGPKRKPRADRLRNPIPRTPSIGAGLSE